MYSLGVSEEVTGRALREMARPRGDRRRHQGELRDEPRPQHGRPVAQAHPAGVRSEPPAAGRRRHRSLSDPSVRRRGADRGDARGAQRPRARRQGALHRRQLGLGVARWRRRLSTSERNGWARFVSMQNHYNLLYREEEREMIPLCLHEGIGLIPWSPLARGVLARPRPPMRRWRAAARRGPVPTITRRSSTKRRATGTWWMRWRGVAEARGVGMAEVGAGLAALASGRGGADRRRHEDGTPRCGASRARSGALG